MTDDFVEPDEPVDELPETDPAEDEVSFAPVDPVVAATAFTARRAFRFRDVSWTVAVCASIVAHFALVYALLFVHVSELTKELHAYHPPQVTAEELARRTREAEEALAPPPSTFAVAAPTNPPVALLPESPQFPPLVELAPVLPPPPPKPQIPDSEWGEKNAKGIALSTTEGERPLKAPTGKQEQAFASRDPQGPGPIPDDPSKSLAPPGSGGDGRRPTPDGAAADNSARPTPPAPPSDAAGTPPPPAVVKSDLGTGAAGSAMANVAGQARDALRAPRESTGPEPIPALEPEGPPGEPAYADSRPSQVLPRPESRVIAIEVHVAGAEPPTEVEALTRPPGDRTVLGQLQPIAQIVSAEPPGAPDVQAALVPLVPPRREPDPLARLVGQSQGDRPEELEALVSPPGVDREFGNSASLADLVQPENAGAPDVVDAIAAMVRAREVEPALLAEVMDRPGPSPEEIAKSDPQTAPAEVAPPTPTKPTETVAPKPVQVASASKAVGGTPGVPVPPADAATDVGMESDPFSKTPNVEFRDGKVEARNGRKVKSIRPRLSDAARRDLISLASPSVLAKVRIDKTGKVVDVTVLRGSGSEAVDMPVYRALWEWWFEPPVDKAGNPLPDVQLIAIHWG
ncbi:MAG TPA: TonB C-terminal domain-containing protein [Tepidisphaeraceae bacterium]|nr:TonB C-terminal domain-containing protein [Tepidisphaeraceae bacterium]